MDESENVIPFRPKGRYGLEGYYSLADLPQRPSVAQDAVSTGWWELDQIWRLYPGQFTVCTGVANHGKSTFLLNVVCNIAYDKGVRSLLYVPENEQRLRDKLQRIWGNRDGFEYFLSDQCFVQSAMPEYYGDEPKTLDWILSYAAQSIERDNIGLLLIDPWNEIEWAKPRDMTMTDYIGRCLKLLKMFSRQFQIAVILVAHPTKAGVAEGKTPSLTDIEGSMNWHNKADNGLIVVRDPEKNATRVISAKVRELGAGKRGACFFYVDEETERFTPFTGAVTV